MPLFRCVEVTTGMLPIAGALQRLAERVGRGRASRFAMLGEPIPGALAGQLGIAARRPFPKPKFYNSWGAGEETGTGPD